MRKFIVIAGFVLASATAQAGERSLSLSGSDVLAAPASAPAKIADSPKTAEAPQVEAPKTEAPKYIERPAAVEPKAETPKVEQATTEPAKPAKTARADKSRHKRYWTEGRIIGELHRHGIYW
jgi:hypothetical protein